MLPCERVPRSFRRCEEAARRSKAATTIRIADPAEEECRKVPPHRP